VRLAERTYPEARELALSLVRARCLILGVIEGWRATASGASC
jgi:hypothetical protein